MNIYSVIESDNNDIKLVSIKNDAGVYYATYLMIDDEIYTDSRSLLRSLCGDLSEGINTKRVENLIQMIKNKQYNTSQILLIIASILNRATCMYMLEEK